MKRFVPLALGALVLASCAPAFNASYRAGRAVNVTTGQEGRVVLGGAGTLAGRGAASLEFGDNVYRGEYNVLSGASEVTLGGSLAFGSNRPFGFGFFAESPRYRGDAALRAGNLIVRNAGGQVISCDFVVDRADRGNGSCTDGAGARYSFQF